MMGFIGHKPLYQRFNGIYDIFDKFSKLIYLDPRSFRGERGFIAPKIAILFFNNIVILFGMHKSVLDDCDG